MTWKQLVIKTNEKDAEVFGVFFEAQGAISVTYSDNADTPVFEPEKGALTLWPNTNVTGLFETHTDLPTIIKQMEALSCYNHATTTYHTETVEDKDWVRAWMDDFHPIKFGRRLWICPNWLEPPEPLAVNIMLDPGLAFGTGTHPTTAMCLQWLDGQEMADKTLTDYGCGSGILAIAGIKLGAKHAFAVDIDEQAIIATTANAEKNRVTSDISACLVDEHIDEPTDVVIANILSGPLKSLYPTLAKLCKSGGTLVLSGILKEQALELIDTYKPSFEAFSIEHNDEWVRIAATRK
ncbi:MAG: 50S ribosomal protein L11 methyltransferase [Pseudomonadota bacterium]